MISVEFNDFNIKYNQRDISARKKMKELIDSDANKVTNVFSTLLWGDKHGAYADVYLNDVVEVQGKLFDFFAQKFPDKDTEDFIETYMRSKTRKSIDESQAYVMTMDVQTLWEYFFKKW